MADLHDAGPPSCMDDQEESLSRELIILTTIYFIAAHLDSFLRYVFDEQRNTALTVEDRKYVFCPFLLC